MPERRSVRAEVLGDRCQGHNRCIAIAPELFDADELGNAVSRNGGRVPPESLARARLAVRNCPERALVLHDDVEG